MDINSFLNVLGGSSGPIHDYAHADRIFHAGNYFRHPKYQFLFYVRINLSDSLTNYNEQREIGALCKTVSLPKFTMQVKNLNAYNRVNLVQTKLTYDPVTFKFHDDAADIIRRFWYDYYSFYYRDSDYQDATYQAPHKYNLRATDQWGYTPRTDYETGDSQLIRSIQIFFFQKNFSSVTLHKPMITSFQHGEHDMAQGTGLLEHTMSVQYETVTYESGSVIDGNFGGDMLVLYDNNPSSLAPITPDGAAGTDYTMVNGQMVPATAQNTQYRGGGTVVEGQGVSPYGMGMSAMTMGQVNAAAGGPNIPSNNQRLLNAGIGIASGVVSSIMRGRNPRSKINAPYIGDLLQQAGGFAGGQIGAELKAAGGLVKAGSAIARGGIGPGNFGTAAVAIKSATALFGKKPSDLIPNFLKSNKATSNGTAVGEQGTAAAWQQYYKTGAGAEAQQQAQNQQQSDAWRNYYKTQTATTAQTDAPTVNDSEDSVAATDQGQSGPPDQGYTI